MNASVAGRVRLDVSGLSDRERSEWLVANVRNLPGVSRVRASASTGTVLVVYGGAARIADVVRCVENTAESLDDPGRRVAQPSKPADGARETAFHSLAANDVAAHFDVSLADGLSRREVAARRMAHGMNRLQEPPRRTPLAVLGAQLSSVPVVLLSGSAVLSVFTGGLADAAAILAVVALNAGIGFATEISAERVIRSLEPEGARVALVLREGRSATIDAGELVPGDVLVLRPGTLVAADARLVLAEALSVDESTLTGESVPVAKSTAAVPSDRPLAERSAMVYRGTVVTGGSGRAVVVATGVSTEIGRIQSLVGTVSEPPTPLESQLDQLGFQLAIGAGAVCGLVFLAGALRGYGLLRMLKTSVSLAVAAVPEGLPTVAMTTLANGVRKMRERGVLVRKLGAVETLGAVQVLCLDKTGTITENRMSTVAAFVGGRVYEARGGALVAQVHALDGTSRDVEMLLRVLVLCSEVVLRHDGTVAGSPTEVALVRLAICGGRDARAERKSHPLVRTLFRSEMRQYMETLHEGPGGRRLQCVKGRPSEVLARCGSQLVGDAVVPLGDADRAKIEAENERMAFAALRVLGMAYADLPSGATSNGSLTWLGLVGLTDPPRKEIEGVIRTFHRAGVETVMITGDQAATAEAVGRRVHIARNGEVRLFDSTRLDDTEPERLAELASRAQVFSRVTPAQKLTIVRALQQAGRVVAMTGDGVNDGPALKAADVSVTFGRAGTPAAREVASVVLATDDLGAMVGAVEQGRTTYDDVRKAVHFILSTNLSEILVTFIQVALGVGPSLTPMELLWINLLTDIFPELALAAEPAEADVLDRPPLPPRARMFAQADLERIGLEGAVLATGALGAFAWAHRRYGATPRAGTVLFTALTSAQLLHAVSARSETHSVFDSTRLPRNRYLPVALGGTLGLGFVAEMLPAARRLLGTVRLSRADWLASGVAAIVPFVVNEGLKTLRREVRWIREEPTPRR